MQPSHLDWIDERTRAEILKHVDVAGYSPQKDKKDVFVPCFKLNQVESPRCTRKQYLGYGLETAPPQLLHPVLGIFVRLELSDLELLHRLRMAIEFHISRPSQCIQKVYDLKRLSFAEEPFGVLLLSCELYRFTLQDLFIAIEEKRICGFPKTFFKFARAFLLQAYLNILDVLDHPHSAGLLLAFSLHPRDIMLDQFSRLMLGNPLFVHGPPPLLAFENDRRERFMHAGILQEFHKLFQSVLAHGESAEILETEKITQQAFGRKGQFLRVRDEIKLIETLVQGNKLAFEFPDEELLTYFSAAERAMAQGLTPNPLAKYNLDREERFKQVLRERAEQYSGN